MNLCNSCKSDVKTLRNFGTFPIVNKLEINSKSFKKYNFILGICQNCGLAQLIKPIDPINFYTDYSTPSNHKLNPHVKYLLSRLKTYVKSDAKIIDIGCNDGSFLDELIKENYLNISGIEPTNNCYSMAIAKGHKVSKNYLNQETSQILTKDGLFDVVISRQVLEHISDLQDFGLALNSLLKPGGYLIIEVPNATQNLSNFDYALWEEHVNYFTPLTLSIYLNKMGFELIEEWNSLFSGECLSIVARKSTTSFNVDSKLIKNEIVKWEKWSSNFESFKSAINNAIRSLAKDKKIILYGVGARSSVCVNFLGLSEILTLAIDDLPTKQNKTMPYSSTKIISLQEAESIVSEECLILLGVNAENETNLIDNNTFVQKNSFVSILPPSQYILKEWKKFILQNKFNL
jgi:2-polyprenyl-3-methyl-5-hydroxy-6-metoxy-1,4-benzoquinol methylase